MYLKFAITIFQAGAVSNEMYLKFAIAVHASFTLYNAIPSGLSFVEVWRHSLVDDYRRDIRKNMDDIDSALKTYRLIVSKLL